MTLLLLIIGIVILLIAIPIRIYNGLVRRRNEIRNAFGTVDAILKQRFDLLPNLVATVKQYAAHEADTLTQVTALRTGTAASYGDLSADEKATFDNRFGHTVQGFYAVAERYPDLKASDNFLHLQRTLNELEEQLSASRRTYNAVVTEYNNAIQVFPSSIIARQYKFTAEQILEIPAQERTVPDVKTLFNS